MYPYPWNTASSSSLPQEKIALIYNEWSRDQRCSLKELSYQTDRENAPLSRRLEECKEPYTSCSGFFYNMILKI